MEKTIIEFHIKDQQLKMLTPFRCYATDTMRYVEAHFQNIEDKAWTGFDKVYAVWYIDTHHTVGSEIINGVTIVPKEALMQPGKLQMNLCANKSEHGILVARMTSYPVDVMQLTRARV